MVSVLPFATLLGFFRRGKKSHILADFPNQSLLEMLIQTPKNVKSKDSGSENRLILNSKPKRTPFFKWGLMLVLLLFGCYALERLPLGFKGFDACAIVIWIGRSMGKSV